MKLLSLIAAAVFAAGMANAVDDAKAAPTDGKDQQQMEKLGGHISFNGKVTGTYEASMTGGGAAHLMAKLQADDGDLEIVDMGASDDLKSNGLDVSKGKLLFVEGRLGNVNGKTVLFAHCISESKIVSIQHHRSQPGASKTGETASGATNVNADGQEMLQTVEGVIVKTKELQYEGQTDPHLLVKLKTDAGLVIADLGSKSAVPGNVNVDENQWLVVTGYCSKLNGKPIIYADGIGNLNEIKRPEGEQKPQNTQGTQQPNRDSNGNIKYDRTADID